MPQPLIKPLERNRFVRAVLFCHELGRTLRLTPSDTAIFEFTLSGIGPAKVHEIAYRPKFTERIDFVLVVEMDDGGWEAVGISKEYRGDAP